MNKKLSAFSFFTFTSAMVMTVYIYPTFASVGASLIFFLIISTILWFLPTALTSAEMATVTNWGDDGLFTWVNETLGEKWAFSAVFFQWFQITIGFVPMLYFIVGMLSVAFDIPIIDDSPVYKLITILLIFYLVTFLQFFGTKITTILSKVGFFLGVLIPVLFLAIVTIIYIAYGNPIQISFSKDTVFPDFTELSSFVIFSSFLLAYLGIEASSVQIKTLNNGKKNYPKIMLAFCVFSLIINMVAGLSIASLVSSNDINLNTGMIDAIKIALTAISPSLLILVKINAFILTLSTIAKISTWIVAPAQGIFICVEKKLLPTKLNKVNKQGVPTRIVILQTVICTFWCVLITIGFDGNNTAFSLSLTLTVLVYLMAYIIMYLAYFKLEKQGLERSYKISKSHKIRMIVSGCGFMLTLFAFIISFVPPTHFALNKEIAYIGVLAISTIIVFFLPLVLYKYKSKFLK